MLDVPLVKFFLIKFIEVTAVRLKNNREKSTKLRGGSSKNINKTEGPLALDWGKITEIRNESGGITTNSTEIRKL